MKATRLIAALASVALLGACSGSPQGDDGQTSGSGPVTVTMWARAATGGITKALVDKFNSSQSAVHVDLTVLPLNQEDSKFAAAVRSGSVPDIFGMNDISVPQFVETGALRPLDDYLGSLDFADQLNKGQIDLATYQDQVYGLPLMLDLSVLWYNKDLFRQAGLDPDSPPTNAEEIIADAKAITALGGDVKGFTFGGNCGGCNVFTIAPMVYAEGTDMVVDQDGKQVANVQDNQPLRDVLQMLKTLWDDGLVPDAAKVEDGSTFGQDFLSGKVGITTNGVGTILAAHDDSFDLGVAPIPGPNGGYSTFAGGDVFVLPAKGSHVEAAETFITWALQTEQQLLYPQYGFTPVRNDVLTDQFKADNPVYAVALEAAAKGYAPRTTAFQSLYSNTGPWGLIFQTGVFGGDIDKALSDGQTGFEQVLADVG